MNRNLLAAAFVLVAAIPARANFTLAQMHAYPFSAELIAATKADRIAWVRTVKGVRNIWVADGPDFVPRQVTRYAEDDGQELTGLALSPDGRALVYVRGGDADANWPATGNLAPNPGSLPTEAKATLYAADPTGAAAPTKIDEGDAPALSADGRLAYLKDHVVWTAGFKGEKPRRLFFDRGKDGQLAWSPDGTRLAFVSTREDHSFVGIYTADAAPLLWLAPSSGLDADPVWSPDGTRIAYTHRYGEGGEPEPSLTQVPHPWSIWSASAATGETKRVWASPRTLHGSFPETAGGANLHWAGGATLTFTADLDNWPHLYAVPASGGTSRLLTPGNYMVEHVAPSRDGRAILFSANTGALPGDDDRRHIFRVGVEGGAPVALTHGPTTNWAPVALAHGAAFVGAAITRPPLVEIVDDGGRKGRTLAGQEAPSDFAGAQFIAPRAVTFRSEDGLTIHGQIFATPGGAARKPALVYVHGGPPRQMLLGWHYMDYYSHAYAMNQYLAAHGYVVLSVNYRLGIGYGRDFHHPDNWGPTGAAEYRDVVAAARFLRTQPGVDPERLGIWGGSYGGYLTGLALARNSDLFKAGVDLHGVHDWSRLLAEEVPSMPNRYEQGDRAKLNAVAFASSPDADIATWTSPVLLIHGDDDRNVRFNQTVDLARRLEAKGVDYEELVLPDEIHGFLRHAAWMKADGAMIDFLHRKLGGAAD